MEKLASEVTVDRKIASATATQDEKLSDLITAVNGMFRVISGTSASVTLAIDQGGSINVPITIPSGYKALSVGRICSNGMVLTCYTTTNVYGLTGSHNIAVWYYNQANYSGSATFTVDVLCVKTIS